MNNKNTINYVVLKNKFSFAVNRVTMYSKIKALRFPLLLLPAFISLLIWFNQQGIILSKYFNAMTIIFLLCVFLNVSKNKDV